MWHVNNRKQPVKKLYLSETSMTVCTSITRHIVKIACFSWKSIANRERLRKISKECILCKIYCKASPRPDIGLPIATAFQECRLTVH